MERAVVSMPAVCDCIIISKNVRATERSRVDSVFASRFSASGTVLCLKELLLHCSPGILARFPANE